MVELTDGARRRLDEYLAEMRSTLRHCPSVDVEDVEGDILEHVEHALVGRASEVDAQEIRDILGRLGNPSRWVPEEDRNRLQRALLALRSGPGDLRVGLISLGLLAATLLTACGLGLIFGPVVSLPFLLSGLGASFVFARVTLSVDPDLGRPERWLIYPSLLAVYVPSIAVMVTWPLAAAILAEVLWNDPAISRSVLHWTRSYPSGTVGAFSLVTIGSLWTSSLGFVAWRWPEVVRDCYAPFADGFRPRQLFLVLSVACLLLFLSCMAVAIQAARGMAFLL